MAVGLQCILTCHFCIDKLLFACLLPVSSIARSELKDLDLMGERI